MRSSPQIVLPLVAMLTLGACQPINARAVRFISADELSSLLPPDFEANEGLAGKLIGVEFTMDARNLKRFAGWSRIPSVQFVSCSDGNEISYSFGPFIHNDWIQNYVGKTQLREDVTYSVIATASRGLFEQRDVCAQLESRWYFGLVTKSSYLPLPTPE